jgi:hypothetical protein
VTWTVTLSRDFGPGFECLQPQPRVSTRGAPGVQNACNSEQVPDETAFEVQSPPALVDNSEVACARGPVASAAKKLPADYSGLSSVISDLN